MHITIENLFANKNDTDMVDIQFFKEVISNLDLLMTLPEVDLGETTAEENNPEITELQIQNNNKDEKISKLTQALAQLNTQLSDATAKDQDGLKIV